MADTTHPRTSDILPVQSRISWGPIIAGATVALALYWLLALLGGAIGLSVSDEVRGDNLMTGAAIWAILSTAVSLFAGGYVVSQLSVGESKGEAFLYGIIMWAVLFAMLLWLMASGVRAGFSAMVSLAGAGNAIAQNTTAQDWQALARQAGVPQEQINQWRQQAQNAPAEARAAVQDPQNRQAAMNAATSASWWAFGGTLISMLAAIGGAIVGAGPNMRLLPVAGIRVESRTAVA